MKKLCIITATRAEYGLLKPLIKRLLQEQLFDLKIVVTGSHLSEQYGSTYQEIEADGIQIAKKIPILESGNDSIAISRTMANALYGFAEYFHSENPDFVLLLGDRYESEAIACAAFNARIPIIHLYGGDTTEGALDEGYRHSITKMSYLHFVSNADSGRRVIQLGENPDRVFNVGSLGVENALHEKLFSVKELEESIGFDLNGKYAVVTFHPVTTEKNSARRQCEELLKAFSQKTDFRFIITTANSDEGGMIINRLWKEYAREHANVCIVESLGTRRYLSAVANAAMVIGNSSSGLVEVPIFHVPTINIGDRQKGRLKGETVIDCIPEAESVIEAMNRAESTEFRQKTENAKSLFGNGNTSEKITEILKNELVCKEIDLKKKFYDL